MVTQDRQSLVIAVLGLGEAGSVIARDLTAAGTQVRGYDPAIPAAEPVLDTASEAEAAREAQLVLSVNSAEAAVEALKAGLPGLLAGGQPRPDVLWADLNTASPGTKRRLAGLAADAGVPFADVAMMAPVPGRGLHVPMLASGTGAARYAALLGPLGAGIEVFDGPAGLAASKKLLRSVFYKGMAASIVEALEAARAAGDEPWLREHIAAELAAADAATLDRITDGTRRHAVRRTAEMAAAAGMLTELGVPPLMAEASRALHERLASGDLRQRRLTSSPRLRRGKLSGRWCGASPPDRRSGKMAAWNVWLESAGTSCGPPTRRPWARGIAIAWAWTPMRTACGVRKPGRRCSRRSSPGPTTSGPAPSRSCSTSGSATWMRCSRNCAPRERTWLTRRRTWTVLAGSAGSPIRKAIGSSCGSPPDRVLHAGGDVLVAR